MSGLSGELRELAVSVEELEAQLEACAERLEVAERQLADSQGEINDLAFELAEAQADEQIFELIADVRRGVLTVEELYERTLEAY